MLIKNIEMGSSISRIYDNYDIYIRICKRLNKKPLNIRDDFYKQMDELKKQIQKH